MAKQDFYDFYISALSDNFIHKERVIQIVQNGK